jgi:hypothetical protein
LTYHGQHLPFESLLLFFLRWWDGMTTDVGSLAPGMDGGGLRSGFGRNWLRKNIGKPSQLFFFGALTFPLENP